MSGSGNPPRKDENGAAKNLAERFVKSYIEPSKLQPPATNQPVQEPDTQSAPGRLETAEHVIEYDRGADGILYPRVPYRSLSERVRLEDEAEARERQPTPPASSSSATTTSSTDSSPDSSDGSQFDMELPYNHYEENRSVAGASVDSESAS